MPPRTKADVSRVGRLLHSTPGRSSVVGIAVVVAALYVWIAVGFCRAATAAEHGDTASLRDAIRLRPRNAEYHNLLGQHLLWVDGDVQQALESFRRAAELNPASGAIWFNLATAEGAAARPDEQRQALRRALEQSPHDSNIVWAAAVMMAANGEQENALREIRVVLQGAPELTTDALEMAWHTSHDADAMMNLALPPNPELYGRALNIAVKSSDRAAAAKFWAGILRLNQPIEPRQTFDYVDFLIREHEPDTAWNVWSQMLALNHTPNSSQPQDAVTNDSFEADSVNGGFDWRSVSQWQDTISIDTSVHHSGTRSVSIVFNGPPVDNLGFYQYVHVKPRTEYEVSAFAKAEDLRGSGGPLLRVEDAYSGARLFVSDDVIGSSAWHEWSGSFRTADSSLLIVRLVRDPGTTSIRGTLWLDDVILQEKRQP